ncbi:TPA: peptide chain release factor 2 [Candidatus Campbellbacteria bacterium]|nr:MAG: peptide chain release factor 2, peptide chain release factor 2 [Candidatus Campbellbacteria bacterium GW2011_OD1_34_28]KKP74743.1 MAG: Peptide chain release factor 2 [Candidatus Campbellbacteria bacterium GW2011_GWD2_35_24]KKP75629.1 MAG: peptide chain release factor 2, peptide chain release factor 2 [Candidatus Campbellbacteria bacterium GW2011_GWC2_35_28]KKP77123.1 MAG: Peptide chain release factor 2 [Candidatus Campbellbacteria bacterium GW2011_GWC1_35_31]KKP79049.1 MAG: Peptide chai
MSTDKKNEILKKIEALEKQMGRADFWNDKETAQIVIKEFNQLKDELEGVGKYDKGNAVVTILSGAGGDDSEDFSRILYNMYLKFSQNKNWETFLIHSNENDHGGYRNITFEIVGNGAYGKLKNESGVHRLVRISPFNAQQKRHTSFSMVEVIPKLEKAGEINIPEEDLKIEFAKSSGPGGQNVNKRETAVRVVHIPTNIAVHVESERSQAQNRERAIAMIEAKLIKKQEEDRLKQEKGMQISATTENEWGSQIRSYVLHPYKQVKDHRTGVEIRDVDKVLEDGEIDEFVEAEKGL